MKRLLRFGPLQLWIGWWDSAAGQPIRFRYRELRVVFGAWTVGLEASRPLPTDWRPQKTEVAR